MIGEDLRDWFSRARADDRVNVHEFLSEPPRNDRPHRAFPSSHESSENQFGRHMYCRRIASSPLPVRERIKVRVLIQRAFLARDSRFCSYPELSTEVTQISLQFIKKPLHKPGYSSPLPGGMPELTNANCLPIVSATDRFSHSGFSSIRTASWLLAGARVVGAERIAASASGNADSFSIRTLCSRGSRSEGFSARIETRLFRLL
jgi:hypothetical protein